MNYNVLYENNHESLIQRLLKARGINDIPEDFLYPTFSRYWQSPSQLNDIDKALDRIQLAVNQHEKIMIFGDYDVDGVSASYIVYTFFKKFLGYGNVSIRLPHRLKDGYGIKKYHLDEIKEAGVQLVITVDNGITAIQEALYARDIGVDMIITDHHKQLDEIPNALAVVNPHISPQMRFQDMCGATVAFKVMRGLAERMIENRDIKQQIFEFFLPIVAVASVADCMPLIDENRLLVKTGLDYVNTGKRIPESLKNFIEYLNIQGPLDTYHIGFLLAPRINAGGRVMTPYDSLYTLLHTGEKQLAYLQKLDDLNTQRKKIQDDMIKIAESMLEIDAPAIIVGSEEFHEGVIGIVAGRLCEKYHKPTIVYGINAEEGIAVASCRGPDYASIIDMLYAQSDILERFGGHKQAGGLTINLTNIDALKQGIYSFAERYGVQEKKKILYVDTVLYPHEYSVESLDVVHKIAPFGEANEEPLFLLPGATVVTVEKVGKNGNGHLKLKLKYHDILVTCMFWKAGQELGAVRLGSQRTIAGKLKKDDFNGGVYIVGEDRLVHNDA